MGHLREAARELAPDSEGVDLVVELSDPTVDEVLEGLELARRRYRRGEPIDVLILGRRTP